MNLGLDHPTFKRLWVRIVLTVMMAGWAMLEFSWGHPIWGGVMLMLCIFCAWHFFFIIDYNDID